jgi:hypothetical protein
MVYGNTPYCVGIVNRLFSFLGENLQGGFLSDSNELPGLVLETENLVAHFGDQVDFQIILGMG